MYKLSLKFQRHCSTTNYLTNEGLNLLTKVPSNQYLGKMLSLLNYRSQEKHLLQRSSGWLVALFQNGSHKPQKIQVTFTHTHSGLPPQICRSSLIRHAWSYVSVVMSTWSSCRGAPVWFPACIWLLTTFCNQFWDIWFPPLVSMDTKHTCMCTHHPCKQNTQTH